MLQPTRAERIKLSTDNGGTRRSGSCRPVLTDCRRVVLSGLHNEVALLAVRAQQRQPPEAGAVPPHLRQAWLVHQLQMVLEAQHCNATDQ